MTDPIARPAATLALALALVAGATPGLASTHYRTTHHQAAHHQSAHHQTAHHQSAHRQAAHRHTTRHHATSQHHAKASSHHHATELAQRPDSKPSGATSVPGGGIKLFCPAHRNPLLIRKSTQGAGTTVTLVCR